MIARTFSLFSYRSGGTEITVHGKDLDVVQQPVMNITMVYTYVVSHNPYTTSQIITHKNRVNA